MNLRKQLSSYIALNNYVEAIKRGQLQLPGGYTQLEYLGFTGTQYINTQYVGNELCRASFVGVLTKNYPTSSNESFHTLFGSDHTVSNRAFSFWVNDTQFGYGPVLSYDGQSLFNSIYVDVPVELNKLFTAELNQGHFTLFYNDAPNTNLYDYTMEIKSFTTPSSIILGALYRDGSLLSPYKSLLIGNVYSFKMWDDNVLVRNLIPAKRNSDNVLGMYDTISGTFFTNSGTGSFVAGPVYNSPIVLTDAITNGLTDLQLKGSEVKNKPEVFLDSVVAKGGTEQRNLPAEYTQLEYITFPSGAYIKTGIVPKTFDYEVGFKGAFGILQDGPNCAWGYMGDGLIPRWICATYGSSYLLNANKTRSFGDADTNTHTFVGRVYEKNGIYCWSSEFDGVIQQNDQTLDNTANWEANTLEMYVGARNNSSTAGNYGLITANHWWCKKAGVMIADYIPAKRNSDNVLGMYDTVSGTFFTNQGTGTFTAGPEVVPTPDAPMDIITNNGVLKVSPNLFDKNASYALYNGYLKNTSVGQNTTLMGYQGGDKTIIIKVAPNTTYTVTRATNLGSVYDRIRCAAFTTLPSSGSTGVILCNYMNTTQANATFTTLSDTQYVAIYVRNSGAVGDDWTQYVDAFQLEKGSNATQYRPYGQIYTDGTPETVTITGKNLFNESHIKSVAINDISVVIPVKQNKTYTWSYNKTEYDFRFDSEFIWGVDLNGNKVENGVTLVYANGTYRSASYVTVTVVSPNVVALQTVFRDNTIQSTKENVLASSMQLEEGIRPTKYEEYYQVSFAPEDLLKLSDYQDVQSVLDGVVTRNVGIKVLDGTENWTRYGTGRFAMPLIGSKKQDRQEVPISTHFIGISLNNVPHTDGYVSIFNGSIAPTSGTLGINYQATPEVAEFKQWLADQYAAGTPVIVVYPLANTVEETVESRDVFITSGTNTIERSSEYVSSDGMTVKYKKLR